MSPAIDKSHPVIAKIAAPLAHTDEAGLRAAFMLVVGLLARGKRKYELRLELQQMTTAALDGAAVYPDQRPTRSMADIAAELLARPDCADLTLEQLKGPRLARSITIVRFEFCYLAHEAGHSYPAIGQFLGGRHHSSVMHAAKRWREILTDIGEDGQ